MNEYIEPHTETRTMSILQARRMAGTSKTRRYWPNSDNFTRALDMVKTALAAQNSYMYTDELGPQDKR